MSDIESITESAERKYSKKQIVTEARPAKDWAYMMDLKENVFNHSLLQKLNRFLRRGLYMRFVDPGPTDIFDHQDEWDICCVLDACRYDVFSKVNTIEGQLKEVVSVGYNTANWSAQVIGGEHRDTIFVSANAWHSRYHTQEKLRKTFFKHVTPWKDKWNEDLRTVLPDEMTNLGIELRKKYPQKKLILFYIQPHDPFIADGHGNIMSKTYAWMRDYRERGVPMGEMKRHYENNLKFVLTSIERLVANVSGRILVTADHGEGLGEFGVLYSHKGGWLPTNLKIPWFLTEGKK